MIGDVRDRTKPTGYVSLSPFLDWQGKLCDPVDMEVAYTYDADMLRRTRVLPFAQLDDVLCVVSDNPDSPEAQEFWSALRRPVRLYLTEPWQLTLAYDRLFGIPEHLSDRQLGGILMSRNKVAAHQLVEALHVQKVDGARLGEALTSHNLANFWDVAEALAIQTGYPLIELSVSGLTAPAEAWDALGEEFWIRNMVVPVACTSEEVSIAMVDPLREGVREAVERALSRRVRLFVTGYRDMAITYARRYNGEYAERSREEIMSRSPEQSANFLLTGTQKLSLIGFVILFVASMARNWLATLTALNALVEAAYALNAIYRLWLMFISSRFPRHEVVRSVRLSFLSLDDLPTYTILVPLYKEAAVLPKIARAITNLRYPKHLLDVKFLLEADDLETIEVARNINLPNFIQLLIIPASEPRTKPKACNFGFWQSRGEYVVIFDAEDAPDPDQLLKAVEVFRHSDDSVACVQAKLSYYNQSQNILTRWFTSEYAMWFDQLLPALFVRDLPIPLGGTSNHFRRDVLRQIGAWDPFNVTEDADLGIRLSRLGYRTVVMDSTTWEEANSDFVNWIRQRSRWVKGYIQTWIVHMRHPVRLVRDLGVPGFVAFQAIILGTPMTFLLNPFLWGLTTAWFLMGTPFANALFPAWVYYLAFLNLALGNFAFMYTNVSGLARRSDWGLVKYATLNPIYWTFMSVAGWKGFLQLFTRPSFWEKTIHGLTKADVADGLKGGS